MAGQRQAHINRRIHRDALWVPCHRLPIGAVTGVVPSEGAPDGTLQFHPVRSYNGPLFSRRNRCIARGAGVRVHPRLKSASFCSRAVNIRRHNVYRRKLRAGIQRFTDHHTGLGPGIGVLDTEHFCFNRTTAGKGLVCIVELIGRAENISTACCQSVRTNRLFNEAADRGR